VQDRLGLIVACVSDRNGRGASSGGNLQQPGISGATSIGFEVPGARRPPLAEIQRQAERARQSVNKCSVSPGRLAPRAVIEVGDRERQTQLGRQPV
jgi:hypothetical protein